MTVPTTTAFSGPYYGNGVTVDFPFGFKVNYTDEVSAFYLEADGSETVIAPADYTVVLSVNENNPGGTLTFVAPPAVDARPIYIALDPDFTQTTKFEDEGAFNQSILNPTFDAGALRSIWLRSRLTRSILLPLGETSRVMPNVDNRKNKFLAFDGLGQPTAVDGLVAVAPFDENILSDDGAGGTLWTTVKGFINYLRSSAGAAIIRYIVPEPSGIVRDILARLLDTRSAGDWGVTGDGSAADLVRINAAFAEAPARSTLVFPGKLFLLNGTVVCNRSDLTVRGDGATFKAKDNTTFEYVFYCDTQSNVKIYGIEFDANQANRLAGQNVRYMGGYFRLPTDCEFNDCTARNALGYSSIPGVGLAIGGGLRSFVRNSKALSCGGTSGTNAADGIYVSGDFCGIVNCHSKDCTDTGAVIENSNYSYIDGFTGDTCNAIAAITNVTNFDKRGNWMRGVSGKDWNSNVTGGIQIGTPSASATGKLLDTWIEATLIVETGGKGTGPAVNVRKASGSGGADGVTVRAKIVGASTQGVLVDALNVNIEGSDIRGTAAAAIQFQTGATGSVSDCPAILGGSFGLITNGTASVRTNNNVFNGLGVSTYCMYAFGTSVIESQFDKLSGAT